MDDLMKLGNSLSVQEQDSNATLVAEERVKQENLIEEEQAKTRSETSLIDIQRNSADLYNLTYQLGTATDETATQRFADDINPTFFRATEDIQRDLEERGIAPRYVSRMTEATNQQQYDSILNRIGLEEKATAQNSAEPLGLTLATDALAIVADVPNFIGGAATIPFKAMQVARAANAAKNATQATRAANAARIARQATMTPLARGATSAAKGAAGFAALGATVSVPQYFFMETRTGAEAAIEIAGAATLGGIGYGIAGAYGAKMDREIAASRANLRNEITSVRSKAPSDVAGWIDKYATQHGVPRQLAYAIAQAESSFDKEAVGAFIKKKNDNAVGVFQIMKDAETDLGIDRMIPEQNVEGGIRFISQHLKYYGGDVDKALSAYNYGRGATDKLIKKHGDTWAEHIPKQTKDYLAKITGRTNAANKENVTVDEFYIQQEQNYGTNTAGAAQADGTFIQRAQDTATADEAPFALYGNLRFDAAGLLKSDENPFLRQAGIFGEDNVGLNRDGTGASFSAEEHANVLMNTTEAAWFRGYGQALDEFAKGTPPAQMMIKEKYFNDNVIETVLSGNAHSQPSVNKAAAELRGFFKRYIDDGFNSGSKYFENVPSNPKYIPRMISPEKWDAAIVKHGNSDIINLIRTAFLKNLDDADSPAMQKLASRLAEGYFNSVSKRGSFGNRGGLHGIDLNDADSLIPLLENQGLGKGEIQEVIDALTASSTRSAAPSRLKRRVELDMLTVAQTPDGELRMLDLYDTDLTNIVRGYGEQVSGHIGMAKIGIKSEVDYKKLMDKAQDWQRENKMGADASAYQRQVARADFLYKVITRTPLDSTTDNGTRAALRYVRDFNVMRLMNNVGFAQLAEFGNILGRGGIDAMLELIPSFKSLSSDRGKFGRKLSRRLYEELEAVSGVGTTEIIGRHYLGWDSMEGSFSSVDKMMHDGKRITSHLSGMAYLMPAMQRMASGVMTNRLASLALRPKLTASHLRELRQLGLDDDMMQSVLTQIRDHATLKGKRVEELNMDKWDIRAKAEFGLAIQRATRRMVQENSYGGSAPLMHGETGKLLFQFKSFIMNAWSKQTLAGAALHDRRTFMSWALSSFIGGSAYIAQTQLMHFGNDDELDERLTYSKIGAASFARAGWASLIPTLVDSTIPLFTGGYANQIFSGTRASGQQSDIITGSPAYSLVDTLRKVAPSLYMPLLTEDYALTETDAKRIIGLLPFVQAMGIRRQLELTIEDAGLSRKRYNTSDQLDPLAEISDILNPN